MTRSLATALSLTFALTALAPAASAARQTSQEKQAAAQVVVKQGLVKTVFNAVKKELKDGSLARQKAKTAEQEIKTFIRGHELTEIAYKDAKKSEDLGFLRLSANLLRGFSLVNMTAGAMTKQPGLVALAGTGYVMVDELGRGAVAATKQRIYTQTLIDARKYGNEPYKRQLKSWADAGRIDLDAYMSAKTKPMKSPIGDGLNAKQRRQLKRIADGRVE